MPREEVGIDLKGFLFADADNRIYARFLQQRRSAPMNARVRVNDGDNALRDFGLNQCIGARCCLAIMRAWFKRHIDACASGLLARDLQCIGFAVGAAAI